jgi:hypothetical protein
MKTRSMLWGKIEATYGLDPVLAATDAMSVLNLQVSPLEAKLSDRKLTRGFFGSAGKVFVGEQVNLTFDIEMFASGVAGTAPAYGSVMKACAQSETVVANTSVTYAGVETGEQSMTFYFYKDGKQRKIPGARGSVKAKLSAGGVPVWSFSFIGIYSLATDVAFPIPTLTNWKAPLGVQAGITTMSLHGYAGVVSEFTFDQGTKNEYRDKINSEYVAYTGREATTGSVKLEETLMITKDWETTLRNATTGVLTLTHGTTAGNRVVFNGPAVQITSYKESDENGIAMLDLGLEFVDTAAGNGYSIVYN